MYLVLFVLLFFLLFFPRGEGCFILHVGGVRDSSSAGQSLTYVSILEAYISFEESARVWLELKIIICYCIYPNYIFTNYS